MTDYDQKINTKPNNVAGRSVSGKVDGNAALVNNVNAGMGQNKSKTKAYHQFS